MLSKLQAISRMRVCLALDGLNTMEQIESTIVRLSPYVGIFKVGKELFTRFGPNLIHKINQGGGQVFLDLKYHDIPNTVKKASKVATELGVYMFNVHASGGQEMMKAAKEGVREALLENPGLTKPYLIAVTVLTSIDQEILQNELNVQGTLEEQVLNLAKMANQSGMDGIVCSGKDLYYIKPNLPEDFMYITPGIKAPNSALVGQDQKRVMTPQNAIRDGSTILVIGRAIMSADDQVKATLDILDDIGKAF